MKGLWQFLGSDAGLFVLLLGAAIGVEYWLSRCADEEREAAARARDAREGEGVMSITHCVCCGEPLGDDWRESGHLHYRGPEFDRDRMIPARYHVMCAPRTQRKTLCSRAGGCFGLWRPALGLSGQWRVRGGEKAS